RGRVAEWVGIEVERAIVSEAEKRLDDPVGLVDAGEDAGRVFPGGPGVGAATEQVRVHADGAVVPRHLVKDGRGRLSDGGEALATVELILRPEQLCAAAFPQQPPFL